MIINLPERFKQKLQANDDLIGAVHTTLGSYKKIIKDTLELFPEYTDHGPRHVSEVLFNADWLIPDKSFDKLNAYDIAMLVYSVLLHDFGMHISYEGLMSLINGDLKKNRIDFFNDLTWDMEWENYYSEFMRWGDKELIQVFGEPLRDPILPTNKNDLKEYHKKLYGEFVRRNHARLSHEISLFGLPAKDTDIVDISSSLNEHFKDLSGLIARSHGIELRSTFDYLKKYEGTWCYPYNIKIVYLMTILRIADFLDFNPHRAPEISIRTRKLMSPISRLEWDWHCAIEYAGVSSKDPELLEVQASPKNSRVYLRLQKLLKDIQYELDMSWAILGEVYGRIEGFRELSLKIRRIKSNINSKEFIINKDYIPQKVCFTSHPDLFKLLIKPLYGDRPAYGVRELLQNAIDACRERKYVAERNQEEYSPLVQITIKEHEGKFIFTITDNGIGMTEQTLIHYYLKAGSSIRSSSAWIKQFEDEIGNSKVQRVGRFGVGALASFLLGEEISVSTRYFSSQYGYTFNSKLDDEQIEIKRQSNLTIGTMIRIDLSSEAANFLKEEINEVPTCTQWYNWYRLTDPQINISIPPNWGNLQKIREINLDLWPQLNPGNLIYISTYDTAYWTYENEYMSNLIVNGFTIKNGYILSHFHRAPLLIVNDFTNLLPLSLDRDSLINMTVPFEKALLQNMMNEIVATMITIENPISVTSDTIKIILSSFEHPFFRESYPLLFTKDGYCLLTRHNLQKVAHKQKIVYVLHIEPQYLIEEEEILLENPIYPFYIRDDVVYKYGLREEVLAATRIFVKRPNTDSYSFIEFMDELDELGFIESNTYTNIGYICLERNASTPTEIDDTFLRDNRHINSILEITLVDKTDDLDTSSISAQFITCNYFPNNVIIPYSIDERSKVHPTLFSDLKDFL